MTTVSTRIMATYREPFLAWLRGHHGTASESAIETWAKTCRPPMRPIDATLLADALVEEGALHSRYRGDTRVVEIIDKSTVSQAARATVSRPLSKQAAQEDDEDDLKETGQDEQDEEESEDEDEDQDDTGEDEEEREGEVAAKKPPARTRSSPRGPRRGRKARTSDPPPYFVLEDPIPDSEPPVAAPVAAAPPAPVVPPPPDEETTWTSPARGSKKKPPKGMPLHTVHPALLRRMARLVELLAEVKATRVHLVQQRSQLQTELQVLDFAEATMRTEMLAIEQNKVAMEDTEADPLELSGLTEDAVEEQAQTILSFLRRRDEAHSTDFIAGHCKLEEPGIYRPLQRLLLTKRVTFEDGFWEAAVAPE